MTEDGDELNIDNIVELHRLRICAALDAMSIDDVRQLVAEIEARIENDPKEQPRVR